MSYAETWLDYLDNREIEGVRHIFLITEEHSDEYVGVILDYKKGMKIPETVLDSRKVKTVGIKTTDNFEFLIHGNDSGKPTMEIGYGGYIIGKKQNNDIEKESEFLKKASELGYVVVNLKDIELKDSSLKK